MSLLIPFVIFAFAQTPPTGRVKADSPLTWREVTGPCSISPQQALDLSRKYLGRSDIAGSTPQLVDLTDRDTLGVRNVDRRLYLTLFDSVPFTRNFQDDSLAIDLHVGVDAESGQLAVAFTPAKAEWIEPMTPRRSADAVAVEAGWTMSAAPHDGMSSTLIEVLDAVFEQYGRVSIDAGQVVVRPRWIVQKFPARLEGETLIPIRPPSRAWLVHTMGELLIWGSSPQPRDGSPPKLHYYTQCIALVADSTLVLCPCSYAP